MVLAVQYHKFHGSQPEKHTETVLYATDYNYNASTETRQKKEANKKVCKNTAHERVAFVGYASYSAPISPIAFLEYVRSNMKQICLLFKIHFSLHHSKQVRSRPSHEQKQSNKQRKNCPNDTHFCTQVRHKERKGTAMPLCFFVVSLLARTCARRRRL